MASEIVFRAATKADLGALTWSGGRAQRLTLRLVLRSAEAGEVELLVGELADGTLACLGGIDYRRDPESGYLWLLETRAELRSQGVGKQLVEALEERARARGQDRVHLAVETSNERATALYRRLGYQVTGTTQETWPTDDGDYLADCWLMEHRF